MLQGIIEDIEHLANKFEYVTDKESKLEILFSLAGLYAQLKELAGLFEDTTRIEIEDLLK